MGAAAATVVVYPSEGATLESPSNGKRWSWEGNSAVIQSLSRNFFCALTEGKSNVSEANSQPLRIKAGTVVSRNRNHCLEKVT